jgi:hypothetical protein
MAGRTPSFNAQNFRDNIRFVMNMAAPPQQERQILFHFSQDTGWSGAVDTDNVPFDPTATVVRTEGRPPVRVPCVVEVSEDAGDQTPFGAVISTVLRLTLLDEDYLKVEDATYIVFDGDKYLRQQTTPPYGLFDVGIHEMVFIAENDS